MDFNTLNFRSLNIPSTELLLAAELPRTELSSHQTVLTPNFPRSLRVDGDDGVGGADCEDELEGVQREAADLPNQSPAPRLSVRRYQHRWGKDLIWTHGAESLPQETVVVLYAVYLHVYGTPVSACTNAIRIGTTCRAYT